MTQILDKKPSYAPLDPWLCQAWVYDAVQQTWRQCGRRKVDDSAAGKCARHNNLEVKMSADKAEMFLYYWRLLAGEVPIAPPEAEYYFDKEIGRKHRFDFAWPDHRIAVEVDGGQWVAAGGRHAKDPDREKLNIAASMRWLVFRFSPDQLKKNPDGCIKLVVQALGYRLL